MKKRLSRTNLLMVLRPGSYDKETGRLDCIGKGQMDLISKKIIEYLCKRGTDPKDIKIAVVSSTAPEAEESAAITAKALGTGYESFDALSSKDGFKGTLTVYCSLKDDHDAVIIVADEKHTKDFPECFGKDQFGANLGKYDNVDTAGVVILDWKLYVVIDSVMACYV
jgi:hypothetical protein